MLRKLIRPTLVASFLLAVLWIGLQSDAQTPRTAQAVPIAESARPQYAINAKIDYELLTYTSSARITIPVQKGDAMRDAVFFLHANAMSETDRPFIVVDEVSLGEQKIPFQLNGPVLRAQLPQAQSTPFELKIDYRGIVPRAPAGSGGLMDAMGSFGGLGGDISGLLGGMGGAPTAEKPAAPAPKKPVDYGLYSYGDGVLSLGSFWYPSLAVRKRGQWMDEAPDGPGDVGYTEASDFSVNLDVPELVQVVTSGLDYRGYEATSPDTGRRNMRLTAKSIRDFAVLMSKDFVVKSKQIEAAGKPVTVSAYVTKKHAAKAEQTLDIAAHAVQIYSKRFGPYPYQSFKVVEGPIRGGAGGMEFSGMTSIASMLYGDWGKQIEGLTGALGLGNLDKLLGGDEGENPAAGFAGGMLGQQKELFESLLEMTIAHETAHQWWAMAVGSDAQREPWVDESLTNYSAILYFEDRYGPEKAAQMMELHLKTPYSMGRMMGGGDAPVNLKTADYANNIQYGAIVYGKGALFYDALRKLVGDEAFFKSLRDYYVQYNGRLAEGDALQKIVQQNAPAKSAQVAALYQRWIQEKHGDEDIAGGQVAGITDILGGLLGGMGGLMDQ